MTTTRHLIDLDNEALEAIFDSITNDDADADLLTYAAASELDSLLAASKVWAEKSPRLTLTHDEDGADGFLWNEVQPQKGRQRRTVCALVIGDDLVVQGLDFGWNA